MASTHPALAVAGPLDATALPSLEADLGAALAGGACLVTCDVSRVVGPPLAAVDALARLQLTARRQGARIRLQGVRPELAELLGLAGLAELLDP